MLKGGIKFSDKFCLTGVAGAKDQLNKPPAASEVWHLLSSAFARELRVDLNIAHVPKRALFQQVFATVQLINGIFTYAG